MSLFRIVEEKSCLVMWLIHHCLLIGGGKITPERIGRLEAMGFEWDPQKAQWDKMFERLKEYHEEMGHCKVPKVRL